jgi:hypothetical protein
MEIVPKLEYRDKSPRRSSLSPQQVSRAASNELPGRLTDINPQLNEALGKPPGRVSPFKGKRSHLTANQIFATTPGRIINSSNTQSVDRHGFNKTASDNNVTNRPVEIIKFENLKRFAPSKSLATPSRMVTGKRKQPQSEQISRLDRPTISSGLKAENEPNTNLLERFKSNRSILKRTLSPPSETEEDAASSSFETDLMTSLNTMKNSGNAKDVLNLLSSTSGSEPAHPRKKRSVVKFDENNKEGLNAQVMETLQIILQNQEAIIRRLNKLESSR